MTGKSLIPAVRDPSLVQTRTLIWQSTSDPQLHSLREKQWKLIDGDKVELFDLENDPSEANDVSAANPEMVNRLQEKLRKVINSASDSIRGALR